MTTTLETANNASGTAHSEMSKRVANVESQFESSGFAQVLLVLAQDSVATTMATTGAALGRKNSRAVSRTASAGLGDFDKYFVVPPEAQDAALANVQIEAWAKTSRALSGKRISFRQNATKSATSAIAQESLKAAVPLQTVVPKIRVYANLGLVLGIVDRQGLEDVRADPRVADVQGAPVLSLIRPVQSTAASRVTGVTWGLDRLGIPEMWAAGFTGKGIVVGHLDTGVDGSHVALSGAIKAYAEFDDIGVQIPGAPPRDSDEHGTHTAGTIVGRSVGTTRFGVAPEAQLASAMVIEGGNVIARILAGMDWAVGQGVQILSMSLGLRGFTPAFQTLSRILRARGVLPVFAVGNEGPGTSRSPGNYGEVLSVGASDQRDNVANFSSSQRFARLDDPLVPDIVAPGVKILSCVPGGKYAEMSGSSMATPHIAGLAALLMHATGASANDVERAILASCTLSPGMVPDRASRGLPNGPRAYEILTGQALLAMPTSARNVARKSPASGQAKPSDARAGTSTAGKSQAKRKPANNTGSRNRGARTRKPQL